MPGSFDDGLAAARSARAAGDVSGALGLYATLRARFPQQPTPYHEAAALLRETGHADEAEFLSEVTAARFPDATPPRQEGRAFFDPAAMLAEAVRLRDAGAFDQAEALLTDVAARQPTSAQPLIELGWLAIHRKRFEAAVPLWDKVRALFPNQVMGFTGGAVALRMLGRYDDAIALLDDAEQRFAGDNGPPLERAYVALDQGRGGEAAERLERLRQQMGDHPLIMQGLQRAAGLNAEPAPQPAAGPAPEPEIMPDGRFWLPPLPWPDAARVDPVLRDFVARFESLGGDIFGCELAMLQRACGAEPLSLLRWADVSVTRLVELLEQRFSGLGAAETTEWFRQTNAEGVDEYCLRDRRGGLAMRSFLTQPEVPATLAAEAIGRRLAFLAARQVASLAAGQRIFVYRIAGPWPDASMLMRLSSAMTGYGSPRLLLVRRPQPGLPEGTAQVALPGLLVGALAGFAIRPDGPGEVPVEPWLTLLGNVAALADA